MFKGTLWKTVFVSARLICKYFSVWQKYRILYLFQTSVYSSHRHLRDIDSSLSIVGGLAVGAESGGKSIHWPQCGAKKCFIAAAEVGNISTTVNKGRWAGPMSSLLLIDVYDSSCSSSLEHFVPICFSNFDSFASSTLSAYFITYSKLKWSTNFLSFSEAWTVQLTVA